MIKTASVVMVLFFTLASAKKKMKKKEYVHEKSNDASAGMLEALNGKCPQTCLNGYMPAPKARRRPFTNGCTVPAFDSQSVFYGDYSHFDKCCNMHDVCYMSCGMQRNTCDLEFKDCLKSTCPRTIDKDQCQKMTNMFYMQEKLYGCQHFRDSQKDLCNCYPPEEAHERVRDYASEFFQVYNKTHQLPASLEKKYFDIEPDSEKHGELILRLYKKYPEGVEIVARDGESKRAGAVYFPDVSASEDNDEL